MTHSRGEMRILDSLSLPDLDTQFRTSGFSQDEDYLFVRYVESAVEEPTIDESRNLTGRFGGTDLSVGVIPPGSLKVPAQSGTSEFAYHDRTALRLAVGPFTGNPRAAVEEGRRVLDALTGGVALRIGRLLIGRTLGERIEKRLDGGRTMSFGSQTTITVTGGSPLNDPNLQESISITRPENDRLLAASRWFGKAWGFRDFEDIFSSLWLSYLGLSISSSVPTVQVDSERERISRYAEWIDGVLGLNDTRQMARRVYGRRNALFHGTNPASIDGTAVEESDEIAFRAIRAELQEIGRPIAARPLANDGLVL